MLDGRLFGVVLFVLVLLLLLLPLLLLSPARDTPLSEERRAALLTNNSRLLWCTFRLSPRAYVGFPSQPVLPLELVGVSPFEAATPPRSTTSGEGNSKSTLQSSFVLAVIPTSVLGPLLQVFF
jgi:hypothetical protein